MPSGRRLVAIVTVLLSWAGWASASTAARASIGELAAGSEVIVEGRVGGLAVAWDRDVEGIYTFITIDVDRVLKGAVDTPRVVIKQLGGDIGGEGIVVPGRARFRQGEEVLLFLEVRPRDRTLYPAGLWQGKWTLGSDALGRRIAVQESPDAALPRWELPLETLASAAAVAAGAVRAGAPLNFAPLHVAEAQPYVTYSPAVRWLSPGPVVVNYSGGQSSIPGGGIAEIAAAIAQWNAAASALRLALGGPGPTRCLFVNQAAGDILVTFDDPCGEFSETTAFGGYTWFYYGSGGTTINGTFFAPILQATVTTLDPASTRPAVQTSSCFQSLMLHELGHAVGFNHSNVPSAIMFASFPGPCNPTPLTLAADDLAGLFFAYPSTASTPGAVSNVQVTVNGTSTLTITFTPATTASSYRLDFRQTVGGQVLASVPAAASPVIVGIPPGTVGTFNVSVTALSGVIAGPPSAVVPFTIGGGCTVPSPVTGVSGGVIGGVGTVRWNASSGATSYIVQAGSVPGASDLFNANVGGATEVSASGLPPGFRAYVRIIPVGSCGPGAPSSPDFLVQ